MNFDQGAKLFRLVSKVILKTIFSNNLDKKGLLIRILIVGKNRKLTESRNKMINNIKYFILSELNFNFKNHFKINSLKKKTLI